MANAWCNQGGDSSSNEYIFDNATKALQQKYNLTYKMKSLEQQLKDSIEVAIRGRENIQNAK
jgi:hypothetical protein